MPAKVAPSSWRIGLLGMALGLGACADARQDPGMVAELTYLRNQMCACEGPRCVLRLSRRFPELVPRLRAALEAPAWPVVDRQIEALAIETMYCAAMANQFLEFQF